MKAAGNLFKGYKRSIVLVEIILLKHNTMFQAVDGPLF